MHSLFVFCPLSGNTRNLMTSQLLIVAPEKFKRPEKWLVLIKCRQIAYHFHIPRLDAIARASVYTIPGAARRVLEVKPDFG